MHKSYGAEDAVNHSHEISTFQLGLLCIMPSYTYKIHCRRCWSLYVVTYFAEHSTSDIPQSTHFQNSAIGILQNTPTHVKERVEASALRAAFDHTVPVGTSSADCTVHQRAALKPQLLVVRVDPGLVQLVVADVRSVLLSATRQLGAYETDKKQPQNRRHSVRITTPRDHYTNAIYERLGRCLQQLQRAVYS